MAYFKSGKEIGKMKTGTVASFKKITAPEKANRPNKASPAKVKTAPQLPSSVKIQPRFARSRRMAD